MKSTKKKKKQARGSKPTCKDATEEEKKRQMTMQEASPAPAPSAQFVGNAFVEQYYHILHQSPNLAHKFYKESSVLCRPDSEGVMSTVTSLQAINDKILSVNYEYYTSEINTVDAQESFKQGLIVSVTGCLTGKDDSRRKFTQTFFLSPQDKGYYVLNDLFRFIGEKDILQMHSTSINAISEDAAVATATELGQCGNNDEKALDALDKSASSSNQSRNDKHIDVPVENVDAMRFLVELSDYLADRASQYPSHSAAELPDSIWSMDYFCRKYAEVFSSSEIQSPSSPGSTESNLPQKVLESLFKIHKRSEYDKNTMSWRNVVKKMQSLGSGPTTVEPQQHAYAIGEEFHMFRETSRWHWDSMRSYYQKAAISFKKGDKQSAAYFSEQGKVEAELAQKAEEKESRDIFKDRNKGRENVITIDLHGQYVKPAMRMVKLHLLFGTYVPSIQVLRVITGRGSHGVGKSKLKQSVIKLLEKEGIEWSEENKGTVLIKFTGCREFSFLDSDSDSDSN